MVLTDTPVKQMLEEEQRAARERLMSRNNPKAKAKKGRGKGQAKKSRPKGKKKLDFSDGDSEDEEVFCLVCIEPWGNSRPGEQWIRCQECKRWAHTQCTNTDGVVYVCQNCESGDSDYTY